MTSSEENVSRAFGELVRTFRQKLGLSQDDLAAQLGKSRTVLVRTESGQRRPAAAEISDLDRILEAEGALIDAARRVWGADRESGTLRVLREDARLEFRDGRYHVTVTRRLQNSGRATVTSYLAKIQVDRYPEDHVRSASHHHRYPLRDLDLEFAATIDGVGVEHTVKVDGPAIQEYYVHFRSPAGRELPLYQGATADLSYGYSVPAGVWGRWFQRAIRLPTDELVVRLRVPTSAGAHIWANEMSAVRHGAFSSPPVEAIEDDMTTYTWRIIDPVLEGRYRIAWDVELAPEIDAEVEAADLTLSEKMAAQGVTQVGADVLVEPTTPFSLPDEADLARLTIRKLQATLESIELHYPFTKGSGLAANQLSLNRSAAVVRAPDGSIIHLLNPSIVDRSAEIDRRFEGCLSFFDLRVRVPRHRWIDVKHEAPWGDSRITRFNDAVARLVAHEIDHLEGRLCSDHAASAADIVPFEDYSGQRRAWDYGVDPPSDSHD